MMSENLTTKPVSEELEHHFSSEMGEDGSAEKCTENDAFLTDEKDFPRAEIDTSAPFESVKEAASRFGGIGFWKPSHRETEHGHEEVHIFDLKKQKALLTDHLVKKESETLGVLKELEHTKKLAGELKTRLQKELSEQDAGLMDNLVESNGLSDLERVDLRISDGNHSSVEEAMPANPVPEVTAMDLNEEKKKNDASVTKASISLLNKRIEHEGNALELTRKRLANYSLDIPALEKELNETRKRLELVKFSGANDAVSGNPTELLEEIQLLNSEVEELKTTGETAKSELFSAMLEIEQTKSRIKVAEMTLAEVNKLKASAKNAEEAAISELKRLGNYQCPTNDDYVKGGVSLSQEEYEALVAKARNAEELSNKRVLKAMLEVDEANASKMEMLMKLDRATEEVKMTKMVMENALRRVETTTMGKLAVEESLRRRRTVHSQKRCALPNSTKFKTVGPSQYRKEPCLLDVNGMSIVSNESVPVSHSTLSIGQILSNKLQHLDQPETEMSSDKRSIKRNESLGQLLGRRDENSDIPISGKVDKADDHLEQAPRKSSNSFARFSRLLATQSKNRSTRTAPRLMLCNGQAY